MPYQELRRVLRQLPRLVWQSSAWRELTTTSFSSWRDLVITEALARYPRQTLAGYERYLHNYTPSALQQLLNKLVEQGYFATERGKYWATAEYQAVRDAWHTATQTATQHWYPEDCCTLHQVAEQLYNVIPLDHFATHQRFAYGVRPHPNVEACMATFLGCWAWRNYEADERIFAWQKVGIAPPKAMLMNLLAQSDAPLETSQLLEQTQRFLADDNQSMLNELIAENWVQQNEQMVRLTATGWGFWQESRTLLNAEIAPMLGGIDEQTVQACTTAYGRIIARTPA